MSDIEARLKKIEEALWGRHGHLVKNPSAPMKADKAVKPAGKKK